LHDPIAGGVRRGIEMQDSPPTVLDNKEAIEHAESYGWYGEEVECGDYLAVVVEERQPTLRFVLITIPPQAVELS